MNTPMNCLRASVASTLLLAVACCGLYPAVVWGIGRVGFKRQAGGSLVVDASGAIRGSTLIGQGFSGSGYFHPRPSAAGNGYDAASSGGSNLGPTSRKLADALRERIASYRSVNGIPETVAVPADAVTASGSGLDPHISLRNAELQTSRVARQRALAPEKVQALVLGAVENPGLGVLGVPGVNVLKLNLALDAIR